MHLQQPPRADFPAVQGPSLPRELFPSLSSELSPRPAPQQTRPDLPGRAVIRRSPVGSVRLERHRANNARELSPGHVDHAVAREPEGLQGLLDCPDQVALPAYLVRRG